MENDRGENFLVWNVWVFVGMVNFIFFRRGISHGGNVRGECLEGVVLGPAPQYYKCSGITIRATLANPFRQRQTDFNITTSLEAAELKIIR